MNDPKVTSADDAAPAVSNEVRDLALKVAVSLVADSDFEQVVCRLRDVCAAVRADSTLTEAQQAKFGLNTHCGVYMPDGTDVPGLVVALDVLGNWTLVDYDGTTRQFLASEVL